MIARLFTVKMIFIAFILAQVSTIALAQKKYSTQNKKAISYYQSGVNQARRFQYQLAQENFENAIKKDSGFLEAYFSLGSIYKKNDRLADAISILEQGIATAESQAAITKYYKLVGDTYFEAEQYKKAREYYQSFLASEPRITHDQKEDIELLIAKALYSEKNIRNPVDFDPVELPGTVNRFPVQYFPVLTADENQLIYTARRSVKPGFDEDIYVSRKDSLGEWKNSLLIARNISRQGINEGACSISADGRTLVFTICNDKRGLGSCDLYITYKTGNKWTQPANLKGPVNSPKWESQPALSANGRTLYFVSDRAGGKGGLDIWYTTRLADDTWTKPVNGGDSLNTRWDDITPFIHVNGRSLYFSSEGRPGFGGFDLYQSTLGADSTWSNPENLGYPLNNHDDQISLFVTPGGEKGYFSYEQKQGLSYTSKIYNFIIPGEDRVKIKSIYLSGKITDAETGQPLGAEIGIFRLQDGKEAYNIPSDSVTGDYLAVLNEGGTYGLYATRTGYLYKELTIDLASADSLVSYNTLNIKLSPVKAGMKSVLKNIFFAYDKYDITAQSIPELEMFTNLLKANKEIEVIIEGHTDNTGSDDYNRTLSRKRAEAVYNYLVNKGIAASRLSYVGKGDKYPVASNKTEDGKEQNRRIEFIIR